MKDGLYKWITALALSGCVGTANAGIVTISASFTEQWFIGGWGNEAGQGSAGTNQDKNVDLFNITTASTGSVGLFNILITDYSFSNGVFFDTEDGGSGFDGSSPIAFGGSTVASLLKGGSDGGADIVFDHSNFGANSSFDWTADLDDTNAVVRGSNGSGNNMDFVGSMLNIDFSINGIRDSLTLTFVGGDNPDYQAFAMATIEVPVQVPTPSVLALMSIGLVGLGWSRRKKHC